MELQVFNYQNEELKVDINCYVDKKKHRKAFAKNIMDKIIEITHRNQTHILL